MLFAILIVIIALIGLLLTLVVLLQSGKGGGLAGIASGGATQQILGARTAPDILEKATWTLGTAFIILCILTNFTIERGGTTESVIQQGAQQDGAVPVLPPVDQPVDVGGGAGDGAAPQDQGDSGGGDQ